MEDLIFKKLAAFDSHDATLISIRNSMYNGVWVDMISHLKRNIETKSYMIRLVNKMRADLVRIDALMELPEDDINDIIFTYGSECS